MRRMRYRNGIPASTRSALRERDRDQCQGCGGTPAQAHHKLFRSRGRGRSDIHDLENLVLLCVFCHQRTHAGDPDMARFRTASWQELGASEADPEFKQYRGES